MDNDLISREAAMEIVKRTSGDYAAAWSEIRRLPAVDAAPVVHGHIVYHDRTRLVKRYDNEPYTCTESGDPLYHATYKHITEQVPYCSECGSRMDGTVLKCCDICGARMDGKGEGNG